MKTNVVFLLLELVAGQTPKAAAQSIGTFTATGNMITTRALHTATLLLDGRVLIAGGSPASAGPIFPVSSAELYDPSTGAFAATGSMTTARASHTATLLSDGKVLIIGGNAGSSAEIYDPVIGTFTPTGDRTVSGGIPTLLNDGKVFIAAIPNAELYDPATGRFATAGSYSGAGLAGLATSTLLADGRVLITGCTSQCDYDLDVVTELYDPASGTFSLTGVMTNRLARFERTTTVLASGKVLFAGGENEDAFFANAELYDPSTGTFTATGKMTKARHAHTATLLPDGEVLITGGALEGVPPFGTHASADLYGPSAGDFRSIGNMTARRSYHRATLLNNGRVLITGGVYWNSTPGPPSGTLASAELYNPPLLAPAPVLLSLSSDGMGQGAILHANTPQLAAPDNPASLGEALEIYLTGLGDGSLIPPQVSIGGRMSEVLWFGNTPAYAGLNQINVRVPADVAPGPAVSVRVTYIGRPSNAVTIGVR